MADSLNRYRVHYRDESPDSPTFACVVRGYDREHAAERFYSGPDSDGWVIVKISKIESR